MAVDKEIKFKFVVDQTSLQSAKRQIEELVSAFSNLQGQAQKAIAPAQKLMGSMILGPDGNPVSSGGDLSGSKPITGTAGDSSGGFTSTKKISVGKIGSGIGGISNTFSEILNKHKNVIRGLAGGTKEGVELATQVIKKGVQEQTQELVKLEAEIQRINKAYAKTSEEYKKAMDAGDKKGAAYWGPHSEATLKKRVELEAKKEAAESNISDFSSMAPSDKKRGLWSKLTAERNWDGSIKGDGSIQGNDPISFIRRGLNTKAGAIAAAIRIGEYGLEESLGGTRIASSESARRGQLVESKIRALMGGDVRFLMNLRAAASPTESSQASVFSSAQNDLLSQVGTRAKAEQYLSASKQALGSIPIIGELARIIGLGEASKTGTTFGAFSSQTVNTNLAQNVLNQVDEQGMQTINLFSNMAQDKFRSELGERVAARRILGYSNLSIDGVKGKGADFGTRKAALESQGYSVGEEMSAYMASKGIAGDREGHAMKSLVMAARAAGYSGYENLLGVSRRMGRGNSLADIALGGGIDANAGIQFGSALLGTGFSAAGLTSGAGVMSAFQSGFNPNGSAQDFVKTQQALAGLQFGNRILSGEGNPYLQGTNLLAAISAAPDGGSYLQDYLAQMDARTTIDIIQGKGKDNTRMLEDLGGDAGMVERTLSGKLKGAFSTISSTSLKEGSLSKKAVTNWREFERGGGDALEYVRMKGQEKGGVKELEALYRMAGVSNSGFAQSEAAAGLGLLIEGMGGDVKTRKGLGRGLEANSLEAKTLQVIAEHEKKLEAGLKAIASEMANQLNNSGEAIKKLYAFGSGAIEGADQLAESLTNLAQTVRDVDESMRTGVSVQRIQAIRGIPKGQKNMSEAPPPPPSPLEKYTSLSGKNSFENQSTQQPASSPFGTPVDPYGRPKK